MWPFYSYPKPCFERVNRAGIPYENVIQVVEEATRVVFKIPRNDLKELPGEHGEMVLSTKTLPVITDTTLPVYVDDGCRVKPLYYDINVIMTASEFQAGHYYLFFYDKCDNVIILMNAESTPAPAVAPAAATETTSGSTVTFAEVASKKS